MTLIEKVLELRNTGLRRKEIAERVGTSVATVGQCLNRLIKRGLVKRIDRNENTERIKQSYNEIHKFNYDKALALRNQGYSDAAVAREFDCNRAFITSRLGKEKRITMLQREIINLRNAGCSNEQIAFKLNKAKGTIGVMLARLIKRGLVNRKSCSWKWHQFSDLPQR